MKTAVLIPCFNEARTIQKVICDFKQALPHADIYVYDNNSTDGTAALAEESGAIVRHEYLQGKGNVIRRMFREIDADCYILTDGDDTYPASAAAKMEELVLHKNADMVVGDRLSSTYFTQNKRPFHNFGNSLVRFFINHFFGCQIKDIMTGYRAFSSLFVKTFPILSKGFEIETEMTIHAVDKNMRVENCVIEYRDRPEGSVSKLNTYSDGIKVIKTILRLYKDYKPQSFFSFFAVILLLAAIIMDIPIFDTYFKTGLVPRFPTLIVSGFIFITALLSLFSGLILQTIVQKDRQAFEFRLIVSNKLHSAEAKK